MLFNDFICRRRTSRKAQRSRSNAGIFFILFLQKQFMQNFFTLLSALIISFSLSAQPDSVIIKKISDEIFTSGQCYKNEEYLCKKIGARLTGSANAEKAVKWTHDLMKSYGRSEERRVGKECRSRWS